jgi:anti-anti-sigma regulatory factor
MADTGARHTCALLVSAEQQAEVAAAFVREGLALGRRAVFMGLESETRDLDRRLQEDGCDTAAHVRAEDLVFIAEHDAAHLFASPDEQVARQLQETVERAVRDGYPGLFVASGSQPTGVGTHEAMIDRLIRRHPLTFLCLYDRSTLDDATITELTALHELDRAQPALFDDGWLRITSAGPGLLRLAGELDYDNSAALLAAMDQANAHAVAAGTDLEVDLASLRFTDVAGLRALHTAARAGPRLRLSPPQPILRRLLDLIDPDGVVAFELGEGRGFPQD